MKLHLPITLRRTLLSLLLPVAGISPSMGTDLFENSEETLSFSNNSRRFYYDSELSLLILLPLSYFVGVKTKKAPFKEGAFC